ncbi:MAG TPA: hypothetical protein VFU22_01040, partial [Roseiflexaceae bacterium]|nr:hypothetical protein [Roseiflexaceae bacterium]
MKQEQRSFVTMLRFGALLFAAVLAAGCGTAPAPATPAATSALAATNPPAPTSAPAAQSPTAASIQSEPVSLTFAFPDDANSSAAALAQIAAYTGEHPGVQVLAKPLPAGDYARQLLDSVDTNVTDIDLFVSADSLMPALINRKAVLDLQTLLAGQSTLNPADFEPAALAAWQRGAALYGL